MYPTLFETGGLGIHSYGLFILLAFSAAFLTVHFRAVSVGIHPDRLIAVYVGAALGGMTGGRLLYAFAVEPDKIIANPLALFSLGGFAFYGGVIGGGFGVALASLWQEIDRWKLADISAPAVLVGLGVGRMGCFFAGCCHGAPAPMGANPMQLLPDGLLGGQIWLSGLAPFVTLEFHGGVGRLLHEPLYPTQLWSAVAGLSLAALLSAGWKFRRFDGQLAGIALLIEPPARILIEAFRADHRGTVLTLPVGETIASWLPGMAAAGADLGTPGIALTTSQAIGLGAMLFGASLLVYRRNAGVSEEKAIDMDAEAPVTDLEL
jgi:phosphatidylglycerol---prolipoprotein diacylglyceryl transferase